MQLKEIRVLHITNVMDIGGVQKMVYQLAEGTREQIGFVVVASTGGEYADKLKAIGVKHVKVPDISSKNAKDVIKLVRIFEMLVKKYRINLIHCHHRMGVLYAKLLRSKCKIIYNNHTIYSDKRILTHSLLKGINLIADGKQAERNLTDYFRLSKENIKIIYNAVDEFDGNYIDIPIIKSEKEKGNFIVMNCSRLHPQKGMNYFIDAAEILLRKKLKMKFFIVGDGEEKSKISEMVKCKGIEKDVLFLGFRNDIKNTIMNSDILVLTSIYEGFPLTPLEAFSVSKTVVATDIDGTNEVIQNGVNGLLAKSKNSFSIAEKIEYLYKNKNALYKMNNMAYQSYKKSFSLVRLINDYITYYKEM